MEVVMDKYYDSGQQRAGGKPSENDIRQHFAI